MEAVLEREHQETQEELNRKRAQLTNVKRSRRDIEMLERELEGTIEKLGTRLRRIENGTYEPEHQPVRGATADEMFGDHPWDTFN